VAASDTATLEASPTPPPNTTNLANAPDALRPTGRALDAPTGFGQSLLVPAVLAWMAKVRAAVSNFRIVHSIGRVVICCPAAHIAAVRTDSGRPR
jgi:hypothetical protein